MARRSPQIDEAHAKYLAGSFTIPAGPKVDTDDGKGPRPWQVKAWKVWRKCGEVRFPLSFLAFQTTRLSWKVEVNGEELDEDQAKALVDEATEGIGEDEMSRLVALNLQVAGEGWYIRDDDGFHVYSVTKKNLGKIAKKAEAASLTSTRVFFSDPEDPDQADSAMQAAIEPAEELLTLSALSKAQSHSRLSQAGMLLYPVEQEFRGGDPFGEDLQKTMMRPIADPEDSAAMVPISVAMSADLIEKVKHVQFPRKYDEKVPEKIEAAKKRVALALDAPLDIIEQAADLNHWSKWAVNEDTYTAYLLPLASRIADLLASVIQELHPDYTDVKVTPDPSELLARKSTVRDALDAHEQGVVSDRFVRDAIGATDEDAPDEEELAARQAATEQREPLVEENPGPPVAASNTVPDRYREGLAMAAVVFSIEQARAKVGAKLRTKLRGDPDLARLDKVPNAQAASVCPSRLDMVDVDATITEALQPFMAWWGEQDFDMSSREARMVLAEHVKATLKDASAKPGLALIESLGVQPWQP